MEIKKFEAYIGTEPELMKVTRKEFIEGMIDIFIDAKICGYEVNGTHYYRDKEEVWFFCDKKEGNAYVDDKVIKLDLSDLGIEIGSSEWDDEKEEFGEFIPEVNLDTDVTKQVKNFRKNIGKYNV